MSDYAQELSKIRGLIAENQFEAAAERLRPLIQGSDAGGAYPAELLREAGVISVGLKDYLGALVYLDAAIRAGDNDLNTVGLLSDVAHHLKCPQVAIDHLGRAAHPYLGSRWARALATLFRFKDAETVVSQLPEADNDPIVGEVRTLIAVGRYEPNRLQVAEDAARRFPTIPLIWGQLAAARQSFGDTEGACQAYREVLKLDPDNPAWHYNFSLSLLATGEYTAGFREYEWRMHSAVDKKLVSHLPVNPAGVALWRGESVVGTTFVLYAEGGIGDGILGLRFIDVMLNEGVGQLKVVVPESLLTLCRRNWPKVVFDAKGDTEFFAGADYWASMLTVPDRIGMRFHTVPRRDGYLKADTEKESMWKARIQEVCKASSKKRSVAMVWHGRVEHDYEKTRAFTAAEFAARVPADTLAVVIQIGATQADLEAFARSESGTCFWVGPDMRDFDDTAAVLMACDDGVFCDTSVAHLAGALGLPMQVLIKNTFIWQWKCLPNGEAAWYSKPVVSIVDDGRQEEVVYARVVER